MWFVFGKCFVLPPSAKAAFALVMWFYGYAPSGVPIRDWALLRSAVTEQYIEAGMSLPAAHREITRIERCVARWTANR